MEIHIQKPQVSDIGNVKVFALERSGMERYFLQYNSLSKTITQTSINPNGGDTIEPFFEIPHFVFDELVKAVTKYATDNNIKTEEQTFLEGKLEASELHLSDLRKNFDKLLDKLIKSN